MTAIVELFRNYKSGEVKQFTQHQFEMDLEETLGNKVLPHDKMDLLLDIFTENTDADAAYSKDRNQL